MFSIASFGYSPTPNATAVQIHPARAAQIAEINAKATTWHAAAHPRFAAEAPGASKRLLGAKGNWGVEMRELIASGEVEVYTPSKNIAAMAIPDAFDSATAFSDCAKVIGDIRDQSNCGCCWAFAGAEAASDRMCIASQAQLIMPLSSQDVCFNSNYDGCDGGQISTPWSYIKSTGVVTGGNQDGTGPFGAGWCSAFSLPHCHHHGPTGDDPYPSEGAPGCPSESSPEGPVGCDSSAKSPHASFSGDKYTYTGSTQTASGVTGIQQMIMEGGPVETAFTVYTDFENYAGGVYQHTSGSFAGGHAVKIVGWGVDSGTKYWKIANSWNPYWGESGYFRIAHGEGGVDDQVIGSSASAVWGKM